MSKKDRNSLIALPVVILIGAGIAWAGSDGESSAFGIPVFALSVILAFFIQWLAFIPAFLLQNEKFYDLTGSMTYISVVILAALVSRNLDQRAILLMVLVIIWALRLGSFLFRRILRAGSDARFDEIKPSFIRFMLTWTLQGLWVSLTLAAALATITTTLRKELGWLALAGILVWSAGFIVEMLADIQKSRFRANPENRDRFIHTGLWARSRHPNYFGEIVIWIGVAILALPTLRGWQYITLISPLFVIVLITRISGIPLLEKRADKKWGSQEDYQAYKERTPVLIPRFQSKKGL
jgi:steroid 5-alpha reductase family enzyme